MKPRVVIACLLLLSIFTAIITASVPTSLTDEQFWKMSTGFSEQDGMFRSDNLLSNELGFQYVVPELLQTAKQGRVYMGVGTEQDFTYIADIKPAMEFIVDICHGYLVVNL